VHHSRSPTAVLLLSLALTTMGRSFSNHALPFSSAKAS
jgi:hypothetical protein